MAGIIHNDAEHHEAPAALDRLMELDPESGTPEADDLQLLALLIETYEKVRWPIGLPDPVDAILFRMDQQGLTGLDIPLEVLVQEPRRERGFLGLQVQARRLRPSAGPRRAPALRSSRPPRGRGRARA